MILLINTAFSVANLALSTQKGDFYLDVNAKQGHSESVLPTIDKLCKDADVDISEIDTVAVVTGPGSFTGLRIGVAIAKALKCANRGVKFISLSSLQAMAYIIAKRKMCKSNFSCVINALSGLYFVCKFNKSGEPILEEVLVQGLDKIEKPAFALLGDIEGKNFDTISLSGQDLLEFAQIKAANGEFVEDLEPHYLRLSQAEDNLLKKNNKF